MEDLEDLLNRVTGFVRPLYQDLDGVSRFDEIERVARIARKLYNPPTPQDRRAFELLLLFHGLGRWLKRVGNVSRALLALRDLTEADIHNVSAAIERLEDPKTAAERAIAGAMAVDAAGIAGLAARFAHARREGMSPGDIAREEIAVPADPPPWIPEGGAALFIRRRAARREFCERLLLEIGGEE